MMKKVLMLLVCFGLLGLMPVRAQVIVNGVNLDKLDIMYIRLIAHEATLAKFKVWVDYGNGWSREGEELLRPIKNRQEGERFLSVIDALNYC